MKSFHCTHNLNHIQHHNTTLSFHTNLTNQFFRQKRIFPLPNNTYHTHIKMFSASTRNAMRKLSCSKRLICNNKSASVCASCTPRFFSTDFHTPNQAPSTPPKALSGEQVNDVVLRGDIVGWVYETIDRDLIRKQYQFKNFDIAWEFMNRVAHVAKDFHHHPEWFNVYNRVNIVLTTHDSNGVTDLDIEMAKRIDDIANHMHAAPDHEHKRVGSMTTGESKLYVGKDQDQVI
mmetsp:Transcript_1083/g.3703  ORF Transcript_1083/g.3703 Transcript_1083/m.3703 type:complete len:232 (-) Transcript_1083:2682-3377(-)